MTQSPHERRVDSPGAHRSLDVALISVSLTRQIGTSFNSTDSVFSQRQMTADTVGRQNSPCKPALIISNLVVHHVRYFTF